MQLTSGRRVGFGLLLSLFAALPAQAQEETRVGPQTGGMDTHLFRSAVDSKGFITTNGTNILGNGNISFGMVLDYGHNLLRTSRTDTALDVDGDECEYGTCDGDGEQLPANDTTGVKALVPHSFQGEFAFNYGIANTLVMGIKVPVVLMTGDPAYDIGTTPEFGGGTYNTLALDQQSISTLSLHAKWRLTRVEKTLGVALIGQLGLPIGDASKNAGADPGVWYWPEVALEHRFGESGVRLGLNGGYRGHGGENAAFGSDTLKHGAVRHGQLGTFNAALGWRAGDAVDLIAETYGSFLLDGDSADEQKLSQEVVGGIKLFVEKNSYLLLGGGGRIFSTGYQTADQRLFLGFIFEPSIGDRDGDGYLDDEDQCPDEPEDFDNWEDEDGCPDPDNDKDGIPDVEDQCVNIPEDKDGDHDQDGCPEGTPEKDRDHDGIYDSKDKCPDQPEDVDGFEDEDGCPDPDNDKDGILDVDDQCPFDPEDKDGFEDEDGCPDPDNDKDQILDVNDKCPNDPETYNGTDDEDGCPDKGRVVIQGNDVVILDKILFETNSAEILEASFPIISAVVSTLHHHPEFKVVEVAGHADERSTDEHNQRLTQARAASVVKALSERGIAAKRLVSQGYGEYCPVDDASNPAAWEKNRRVEFKIVKTDTGMTGVDRGCERARSRGVIPPPVASGD